MIRENNIHSRLRRLRLVIILLATICGTSMVLLAAFMPVDEKVRATGSIHPDDDTHLYSPMESLVEQILVAEGNEVESGDVILILDTHPFEERLAQLAGEEREAQADLELKRAQLERTAKMPLPAALWNAWDELGASRELLRQREASLERYQTLFDEGLVSAEELAQRQMSRDEAALELRRFEQRVEMLDEGLEESIMEEMNAALSAATARLMRLKTERDLLKHNIERCHIRAPMSGMVTHLSKSRVGEKVERGEKLAHISHGTPNRAELRVGETQIHRLEPGQRVLMRSGVFDSFRHGRMEGEVERVGVEALPEPGANGPQYRVSVRIDQTPVRVALGSSVEAEIYIDRTPLWRLMFPFLRAR